MNGIGGTAFKVMAITDTGVTVECEDENGCADLFTLPRATLATMHEAAHHS